MTDPLDYFTRRCEREPGFLGHALARLRDARGWSDDDLCAALGCDARRLRTLKRCGLPNRRRASWKRSRPTPGSSRRSCGRCWPRGRRAEVSDAQFVLILCGLRRGPRPLAELMPDARPAELRDAADHLNGTGLVAVRGEGGALVAELSETGRAVVR
jgi:hypothetical protein